MNDNRPRAGVQPDKAGNEKFKNYTSHSCNLKTINSDGLRKRRKRTALGRAPKAMNAAVCVITESRVRRRDLGWVQIPNHEASAHYCGPTEARIGGGVLISA